MNAKILVVDDHEIVRKGICKLIEESGRGWEICGEGASGSAAIEGATNLKPDLVVLDVSMPTMSGLEGSVPNPGARPALPEPLFTMYDSKILSAEAQQVGAHGYVLKSQAARDLILAIEKLLAGGTFFGDHESEAEPQQETESRPRVAYRSDLGFSPARVPTPGLPWTGIQGPHGRGIGALEGEWCEFEHAPRSKSFARALIHYSPIPVRLGRQSPPKPNADH